MSVDPTTGTASPFGNSVRAAMGSVDITCEPGVPLGGNARADKAARGVHDPLFATVLLVDGGHGQGTRAEGAWALIGLDLLATTAELTEALAQAVCAATDGAIAPARVVVCASHTHSGPDVLCGMGFDLADYAPVDVWRDEAVLRVAELAAELWAGRSAVTVTTGQVHEGSVAFNRRLAHRDGHVVMNWEDVPAEEIIGPLGEIDPRLTTLVFEGADGAPIGAVLHYTLHPAILAGHDWLVSADWVATARRRLSVRLGGAPVLFLNGALGDINHLDYRQPGRAIGFDESERVGSAVGAAACASVASGAAGVSGVAPHSGVLRSRLAHLDTRLPQRVVDPAMLAEAEALLAANAGRPVDALDGIPPEARAQWVVSRGRWLTEWLDVRVRFFQLGQVSFVGVPFEVFVEFGLALSRRFPEHEVRVVSLTGDYLGYLPTAVAFTQGGYEPSFGTSTVCAGAGERLFATIEGALAAFLDTEVRP